MVVEFYLIEIFYLTISTTQTLLKLNARSEGGVSTIILLVVLESVTKIGPYSTMDILSRHNLPRGVLTIFCKFGVVL